MANRPYILLYFADLSQKKKPNLLGIGKPSILDLKGISFCMFFFKGFHRWHISKPVAFRPEFRAKDTQETRGVGVKDSSKKMAQFDFSGSIELITRFKTLGNPTYIAQNSHV